jgi:hypothetical protein
VPCSSSDGGDPLDRALDPAKPAVSAAAEAETAAVSCGGDCACAAADEPRSPAVGTVSGMMAATSIINTSYSAAADLRVPVPCSSSDGGDPLDRALDPAEPAVSAAAAAAEAAGAAAGEAEGMAAGWGRGVMLGYEMGACVALLGEELIL